LRFTKIFAYYLHEVVIAFLNDSFRLTIISIIVAVFAAAFFASVSAAFFALLVTFQNVITVCGKVCETVGIMDPYYGFCAREVTCISG